MRRPEERRRIRRIRAGYFFAYLSGFLSLALAIMVAAAVWTAGMRKDFAETITRINSQSPESMARKNEAFKKWLIDEGNFRHYRTMRDAWRDYEEIGSEIRRRKAMEAYREEIVRLLRERALDA